MLHLLQRFKIAMDRHRSNSLITNTKQRFECSPFRVYKSPLATPLSPRNALVEREIRGSIPFRFGRRNAIRARAYWTAWRSTQYHHCRRKAAQVPGGA